MTPNDVLLPRMARALANRESTLAWLTETSQADLESAWNACPDARALFRLVAPALEPERRVRACCACLRYALGEVEGFHRIRSAAKLLEQWTNGAAPFGAYEEAFAKIDERYLDEDLCVALAEAAKARSNATSAQEVAATLSLALSNEGVVYSPGAVRPPLKTRVVALARLADAVRGAVSCPQRDALIAALTL